MTRGPSIVLHPRGAVLVFTALVVLFATGIEPGITAQGRQGRGPAPEGPPGPRLRALVVSGGCCHDYPEQARVIMNAVSKVLPVDWMVAVQGGRGTRGELPVYADPNWARGYDIVVHNECFANVTDQALIRRITDAHKQGVPAVVIHCAMHTFRASSEDVWREFLGVTTRQHTAEFRIPVKIAAADHPIMKGFKADWVTPMDELYVIDKFWPGSRALATATSPEDKREYPLVWTNDYHGARVFGTTLGHGNETFADPVFQDLLARGFKWAVGKD